MSEGRLLFETDGLIFRGEFWIAIPLKTIQSVEAREGRLAIASPRGVVTFDLGSRAEDWARRIRHPKSLMDKLGVKPASRVSVIGVQDESFWQQLGAQTSDIARGRPRNGSDSIFLAAKSENDLKRLKPLQRYLKQDGAIWVIRARGASRVTERGVMDAGKAAGLVDTKVVRFSDTHTAEKFVIPLARRGPRPSSR